MVGFGHRGRCGRIVRVMALGAGCLALAACANSNIASRDLANRDASRRDTSKRAPVKRGSAAVQRAKVHARTQVVKRAQEPEPGPHEVGSYKNVNYSAVGLASWYGAGFHGRRTADGETFNMHALSAAHRTLPLPCKVRVTNLANHRSLVVRVNDRGPYVNDRVIDVSAKTAKLLGFYGRGVARVKVDYVGRAPLPGRSRQAAALE